jgi:hypothetical protein
MYQITAIAHPPGFDVVSAVDNDQITGFKYRVSLFRGPLFGME